jgi:hypothetical protein
MCTYFKMDGVNFISFIKYDGGRKASFIFSSFQIVNHSSISRYMAFALYQNIQYKPIPKYTIKTIHVSRKLRTTILHMTTRSAGYWALHQDKRIRLSSSHLWAARSSAAAAYVPRHAIRMTALAARGQAAKDNSPVRPHPVSSCCSPHGKWRRKSPSFAVHSAYLPGWQWHPPCIIQHASQQQRKPTNN